MRVSYLNVRQKPSYLDSGCSIHMASDKMCLLSFEKKNRGYVIFENNDKAHIKGKCMIGKYNSAKIEDV